MTTSITSTILGPGDRPAKYARVRVELAGENGAPVDGFLEDSTQVEGLLRFGVDDTGTFVQEIIPNELIVIPAGNVYHVTIRIGRTLVFDEAITVPNEDGTFELETLITDFPGALDPSGLELERQARIAAVDDLQAQIDEVEGSDVDSVNGRTGDVVGLAEQADLDTEAAARVNADSGLGDAIDAEATRATTAEALTASAVSAETSSRVAGDSANAAAITTEATTRATADATNAAAILAETTARTAADATEAATRAAADTDLHAAIDDEASARADADTAEAAERATADALLIPLAQKGAANGVATLGSDSKIPSSQLPAIAITDTFVVASQAAMLALTAQTGDVAVRTDTSTTFILKGTDPTVLGDWELLRTPVDAVLSVNGQTGAVTISAAGLGALVAANNLSDLTDAAAARSHLGLGTAATANSTAFDAAGAAAAAQAFAIQRANHTGTQTASTISDLTEAVQDIVGAFVAAGANIGLTYDDAGNVLTIAVTGLTESVQDVVGALAAGGSGLTATYDDTANTWVLDVNVDGSSLEINADTLRVKAAGITNAMLAGSIALSKLATDPLARSNHTGTQTLATISDAGTAAAANTGTGAANVPTIAQADARYQGLAAVAAPKLIVPPASVLALVGATVWPAANRAIFNRFSVQFDATYRYVNWRCDNKAGNIQVGIVRLTGTGYTTYASVVDSGVITCPNAGDIQTDLGATLLTAGEYALFLWASDATFQSRPSSNSGITSSKIAALVSSLTSGVTSGTLAFNTTFVGFMTLEAA